MPAAERRASILIAAAEVFGERGYAAATTDAIAQIAGISQAYVIRTVGSKEALFIATAERVLDLVAEAFRSAISEAERVERAERIEPHLGAAYVRLAEDRGPAATELLDATFRENTPLVRELFGEDASGRGPDQGV